MRRVGMLCAATLSGALAGVTLGMGVAGCGSPPSAQSKISAATVAVPAAATPVSLLVDDDRNGVVDAADRMHKNEWNATYGAVLLANVDDDDGDHKEDFSDDIVNGTDDEKDLARIVVEAWPQVPAGARGTLTIGAPAAAKVHLFKHIGTAWSAFHPQSDTLTAAEMGAGVELGIEATDFPSPTWDGTVELTLEVTDGAGAQLGTDLAQMRVAPLVVAANVWDTGLIYVSEIKFDDDSAALMRDLDAASAADGQPFYKIDARKPAYSRDGVDQWTQDFMEFGWTAMPGPEGKPVGMSVVLRAPTQNRPATSVAQLEILGKDFGYAWKFSMPYPSDGAHDPSLDSGGDLDVIPPYENHGVKYPLGRVFHGETTARHGDPVQHAFLDAQKVQGPMFLVDTTWLLVGHVDEVTSFVRTPGTAHGWKLLVASPRLARQMMQDLTARDAQNGNVLMFAGMSFYDDNGNPKPAQRSIKEILSDENLMAYNQTSQAQIDLIRQQLQQEVGLADDEIVEVPVLLEQVQGLALAYMPGTVNLLFYGQTAIVPAPHGAVISGTDFFAQDMVSRLGALGITARFAEDWNLYHALEGEVHCGTNPVRKIPADAKWWEVQP